MSIVMRAGAAAIATALAQLKDFKPVELKKAPPYPTTLGK